MDIAPTPRRVSNANDMTTLLTKIERRLGMIPITPHLPEYCNKDAWAQVIKDTTLPTFSRGFPNMFYYRVNDQTVVKKDGWLWLKEEYLGGAKFLGFGDIDWQDMNAMDTSAGLSQYGSYGYPIVNNFASTDTVMSDQMMNLQLNADLNSMLNSSIYVDSKPGAPAFRISAFGNQQLNFKNFTIILFVEHSGLNTISPTSMETFEKLATCDVADLLLNLAPWEDMQTAMVNVKLPLDRCRDYSGRRDDLVDKIEAAGVSANNLATPIMMCV